MGMITGNKSCDSKINKSRAIKQAKGERHRQNVEYRAELHREKGQKGFGQRDAVQSRIDEISKRGASH